MASVTSENLIEQTGIVSPEARRFAEERGVVRELLELGEMTEKIFPGEYTVDLEHDPEIPNYSQLVIHVSAVGSADEIAGLNHRWHRQSAKVTPNLPGLFCLSISMRE